MASVDRGSRPCRAAATQAPGRTAALYPRLPRGPHRLDPRAVALNQRARIFGAMVEAVARDGYHGTSVRQVVALAGVSRRSFYEHFANKEACFLATFDAIVARGFARAARAARAAASRDPGATPVEAALAAVARVAAADRKAATLVACESRLAGRAAVAHLRAAAGRVEPLLARGFARPGGRGALPAPIARAVAGGLHGILARGLADGAGGVELEARLAAFARPFSAPLDERFAAALAARAAERLRALSATAAPSGGRPVAAAGASTDRPRPPRYASSQAERVRLMAAALRLAVLGDFGCVSPAQIADEAGLAPRAFEDRFADAQACYAAGLEEVAAGLLAAVATQDRPRPGAEDWPQAVAARLDAFLGALVRRPLHAHTLAQGVFSAGASAVARGDTLMLDVAALLAAGAPARPDPEAVRAGVADALWHTIGCHVAAGRMQLLPLLRDHLAFVVLAPYAGHARAAAAVVGAPAA